MGATLVVTLLVAACGEIESRDDPKQTGLQPGIEGPRGYPSDPGERAAEGERAVHEAADVVPAGTNLLLVLDETVSTRTHSPGDGFTARVREDVVGPDGSVLVERGTPVHGTVLEARQSGGPDEEAVLAIGLERIEIGGDEEPLRATVVEATPEASERDSPAATAGKVAVGAAAGALIGQVLGRDTESTLKGAGAGAVAGAAVALATRGGHATLAEGSVLRIRLDEPLAVS